MHTSSHLGEAWTNISGFAKFFRVHLYKNPVYFIRLHFQEIELGHQKFDDIFNRRGRTLFVDKEYHIYSRSQTPGDLSQFEAFTKLGLPIKFHIDEHPLISLYHLIQSDVKVLSNSSFSYMSALYGDGLNIVRDNFFCKLPYNAVYTDYDGNFDESQICFEWWVNTYLT